MLGCPGVAGRAKETKVLAQTSARASLKGLRVLVVEDEYFIADDIGQALERSEAVILGPVPTAAAARAVLGREKADCILLDLNLRGELTFTFADELRATRTPLVFATGYDAAFIPERLAQVPRLEKPLDLAALVATIARVCKDVTPA